VNGNQWRGMSHPFENQSRSGLEEPQRNRIRLCEFQDWQALNFLSMKSAI